MRVSPVSASPLRIALIAPNRFAIRQPFAGGLEAHVWHLTRALVGQGHHVTLYAAHGSRIGLEGPQLTVRTLARTPAAARSRPAFGAVFESDHHAYLRLMMELADRGGPRFDVIHNHSLHQLPITLARRLRAPMLTTLHTPPFAWLEAAAGVSRGNGVNFAAVSRSTATAWARALDRITVVPNGVDVERWPVGPGGRYLVWSGRITPEKGPHLAIEAARRAGLELVLSGPIGNPDYFRLAVAPNLGAGVTYAGHLHQDDLAELVGGAGASLVTPLWDEPYGLVVAESLACGTPVVAFERGGVPEIIDATCGRLVRPRDVAAMAAMVPEALGLSRTAVREHALIRCSADVMVGRYLALYRELIDEQDDAEDDRLLRAPSGQRASRPSVEHLRTPA